MSATQTKITKLRAELRQAFVDRGLAADGVLLGLLTGQNVLLVGPPGTAKSALARTVCDAISGARFFTSMVGKTTTPEALFGPIDIAEFEAGRYKRRTERFLPNAHVAHLDEVFRGSAAILDTMLKVLNERKFDNDGEEAPVPVRLFVGTTNSVPEEAELQAFFDRFPLRFYAGRLRKRADRLRLLGIAGEPQVKTRLTLKEVDAAVAEAQAVTLPQALLDKLVDIWEALDANRIDISERKARQILRAIKARAYLAGRTEATVEDLEVIADSAWATPQERPTILRIVLQTGSPNIAKAIEVADAIEAILAELPDATAGASAVTIAAAKATERIDGLIKDMEKLHASAGNGEADRIADLLGRANDSRSDVVRRAEAALRRG